MLLVVGSRILPESRGPKPEERQFSMILDCLDNVDLYFDASRRGKKELKSSRDKKCKARTVVGRGEEPAI